MPHHIHLPSQTLAIEAAETPPGPVPRSRRETEEDVLRRGTPSQRIVTILPRVLNSHATQAFRKRGPLEVPGLFSALLRSAAYCGIYLSQSYKQIQISLWVIPAKTMYLELIISTLFATSPAATLSALSFSIISPERPLPVWVTCHP